MFKAKFNSKNKVNVPSWATAELARMLIGHDRLYLFSDDQSAYANGQAEEKAIVKEIQSINPCSPLEALNIVTEIYRS